MSPGSRTGASQEFDQGKTRITRRRGEPTRPGKIAQQPLVVREQTKSPQKKTKFELKRSPNVPLHRRSMIKYDGPVAY